MSAILNFEEAGRVAYSLKKLGHTIVATSGCFDLLHIGHIELLRFCKERGTVFVGLNTDESVRGLKGGLRPLIPLEERAQVLLSLRYVDYVVPFSDLRPFKFIERILPDIWVKGSDYIAETLPEKEILDSIGARIELCPIVSNKSTTKIIEGILNAKSKNDR